MRSIFLLILLSKVHPAFAKEAWFCTDESSAIINNTVQACGIGTDEDEGQARAKAFDNAQAEFRKLCAASDNCRGHEANVDPKRTTCEHTNQIYKCHRMLAFQIRTGAIHSASTTPTSVNVIRRGMSMRELDAALGTAHEVQHITGFSSEYEQVFYRGKMCAGSAGGFGCYVIVTNGKVTKYQHFKPEYTNYLNEEESSKETEPVHQTNAAAAATPNWGEINPLVAKVATVSTTTPTSSHAGYEKTRWGMSQKTVAQIYPKGEIQNSATGEFTYGVVRPIAGLTGYIIFNFDSESKLNRVTVLFPEQGSDVDLKNGKYIEPSVDAGQSIFKTISVALKLKYGGPAISDDHSFSWTSKRDAIILMKLPGFNKAHATIGITYQQIPTLSELSDGL